MEAKRTALYQVHVALGAKMIPFAGYDMPVRYNSLIEEHMAVRKSVGVFDVSHMGEFILEGPSSLDLIQRISSCLLYTSPSPRDQRGSRMPSSA